MIRSCDAAIAAMGTTLGPEVLARCHALFDEEQRALMTRIAPLATDCAYGPHPRHRLDLYALGDAQDRPVVLFVHGGGFRIGDKGGAQDWGNASVGRTAAQAGFLGAVMNYRLVPDALWPNGGEDVIAAIAWLRANAAAHGGDPRKIVVVGTSAGAIHIATALQLDGALPVRGAVLLSGLYGYTPLDERDTHYYGDHAHYADRMPRAAVAGTDIPLFVVAAQFDPPRFQDEFLGLMRERLDRHGTMPAGTILPGHNHYSLSMHIGTSDRRLADEIANFVTTCCT